MSIAYSRLEEKFGELYRAVMSSKEKSSAVGTIMHTIDTNVQKVVVVYNDATTKIVHVFFEHAFDELLDTVKYQNERFMKYRETLDKHLDTLKIV